MTTRGQANLPALAVALIALTATAGLSFTLADGAFASADRDAAERRLAVSLSERLVDDASMLTTRENVINRTSSGELTPEILQEEYPVTQGHAIRIQLDGETLVEHGDPTGGETIRRIVLIEQTQSVTVTPDLTRSNQVTLPRRTGEVTIHLTPPPATNITVVRVNDRVVLANETGLTGTMTVTTSRFETTTLQFEATGQLPPGSVEVTSYPTQTTKAQLVVTVDA
ncbi:hypothetical protein [Haladaptatus sp. DJG-WS-42]|uniref:DUF7263 family protein n=1 Tax=Haladaptatus sp. DJG-WS-42 TaxID=3120516 RepID=UPI0030CD3CF7